MKKMICNIVTIMAAFAFLMVMGAAIEGTVGLIKSGIMLAGLGFMSYKVYQIGEMPAKSITEKTSTVVKKKKTAMVAMNEKRTMRAA